MKFDPSTTVFDACRMIREKIGDIVEKECKLIGDHCLHLVVLSFNMCFFLHFTFVHKENFCRNYNFSYSPLALIVCQCITLILHLLPIMQRIQFKACFKVFNMLCLNQWLYLYLLLKLQTNRYCNQSQHFHVWYPYGTLCRNFKITLHSKFSTVVREVLAWQWLVTILATVSFSKSTKICLWVDILRGAI